jgi:methylmalonyl-CoA mutase N-terminal domain/subunit
VRTTVQALAAVLGGTQSLHVNSKDEALALPTEDSVQLSLRTQQILAYEMGVADTVDPLAGSYYVENMTDEVESKAFEYIARIDDMGGALAALDRGYQVAEIHESAFRHQRQVESEERTVVGVNRFQSPTPPIEKLQTIDQEETLKQLERLADVKRDRDDADAKAALTRLEDVARGSENTMPAILECVEAYATVGEISDVLRKVFGEQRELSPF